MLSQAILLARFPYVNSVQARIQGGGGLWGLKPPPPLELQVLRHSLRIRSFVRYAPINDMPHLPRPEAGGDKGGDLIGRHVPSGGSARLNRFPIWLATFACSAAHAQ